MKNLGALLQKRVNTGKPSPKMAAMALESADGKRSTFSGLFTAIELNQGEKETLKAILEEFSTSASSLSEDLAALTHLTSEIKSINNQAALLHGERIQKARTLFKSYKEGAFSSWMIAAYGNRQTPYNFLQYYEFCESMPSTIRAKIELMPRQAIYTLASREGPQQLKQELIQNFNGETKQELLTKIRQLFPLSENDKRRADFGETAIAALEKLCLVLKRKPSLTKNQRKSILSLLEEVRVLIE